jgi:hypothetical protein
MNESNQPDQLPKEGPRAVEDLRPLGIRHILIFTTSIAIALAIISPIARAFQPKQSALESSLIFVVSLPYGLAGGFLAWIAFRAYSKKALPVVDPGGKFAILLSALRLVLTTLGLMELGLFTLTEIDFVVRLVIISRIGRVAFIIAWAIIGYRWIKEPAWRVVITAQAIGTMFCLWPLSAAVGGAALVYAYMQDKQAKHTRHWTHYFGILLWALSQFAFL